MTITLTGFGQEALAATRAAVLRAKAGDPLAPVTVLVPENIAALSVRRYLAGQEGGIAGVVVTTVERLAEQVAAPLLAPRRPATTAVLASYLRRTLASAPGVFERVREHPATVRALLRAHRELRDLDDPQLDAVAGSGTLAAAVVGVHRRVRDEVAPAWYDAADLLVRAAAEQPKPGRYVLVAASRLSHREQGLVRMLHEAEVLDVVACVTRVRRADDGVLDSLRGAGLTVPEVPADLARPVATPVRDASDSDAEARDAVRVVLGLLEQLPAHRIAVLYPSAVPYARTLHERLGAAGITTNGRGVLAVSERAIARAFLGLLRLPERNFARADLIDALSQAPVRLDGEYVPLTRWDRTARAAGVVEREDWQGRLAAYAQDLRTAAESERAAAQPVSDDGEEPESWRAERLERDADAAEEVRDAVTRLRSELERGTCLRTWTELADWALALFHATFGDADAMRGLPPEEQYAAATLSSALTGLAVLGEAEPEADLATAIEVLQQQLDGAVARVGRFGEGVYVSALGEAALLDVDAVVLVGMSEDVCPGRVREDALLSENARAAGALPPARTVVNDTHRAVLAAFAAAPHSAVASFPRGDLRRSTQRHPSRFLLPSLRELARDRELVASAWGSVAVPGKASSASFAAALLDEDEPVDEQEWRVRAAAAGTLGGDAAFDAASTVLQARRGDLLSRFDGDLTGVTGLPNYAVDDVVLSPTALEALAICPHAYFVERLLRVRPLEAPEETIEPPPNEVGTLVHASLDRLVREARDAGRLPVDGAPWSAADRQRLHEIFAEESDRAAARGLMGHPRLWQRERLALERDLELFLDDDDRSRAERGSTVLASELEFGMHGTDPVVIALPTGQVRLRGSVDRVERNADGTLHVIDLKTGGTSKFAGITESDPTAGGTKLQLPAYAAAARGAFGDGPVHSEYWFARRKGQRRK